MNSENYVVFYSNKKSEDNIMLLNMFENCKQIDICWDESTYEKNIRFINSTIKASQASQIIFSGLEFGWDKLIKKIKQENPKIKIKVICNTSEALLYYDYERDNFFKMLELSKEKYIDNIAFLKHGQYVLYNQLGYNCSFLMQNYTKKIPNINNETNLNKKLNIGIYPLNYTWDKNIFNQLCIGKFIENSVINYNKIDERMEEFLNAMKISNNSTKIKNITEDEITKEIIKNDIIVSCSFTDYYNPIFFIAMENGIPCVIGNTSNLFDTDDKATKELKEIIVSDAEDNPISNSKIIKRCLEEKDKIIGLYVVWKNKYNKFAQQNMDEFLKK